MNQKKNRDYTNELQKAKLEQQELKSRLKEQSDKVAELQAEIEAQAAVQEKNAVEKILEHAMEKIREDGFLSQDIDFEGGEWDAGYRLPDSWEDGIYVTTGTIRERKGFVNYVPGSVFHRNTSYRHNESVVVTLVVPRDQVEHLLSD